MIHLYIILLFFPWKQINIKYKCITFTYDTVTSSLYICHNNNNLKSPKKTQQQTIAWFCLTSKNHIEMYQHRRGFFFFFFRVYKNIIDYLKRSNKQKLRRLKILNQNPTLNFKGNKKWLLCVLEFIAELYKHQDHHYLTFWLSISIRMKVDIAYLFNTCWIQTLILTEFD